MSLELITFNHDDSLPIGITVGVLYIDKWRFRECWDDANLETARDSKRTRLAVLLDDCWVAGFVLYEMHRDRIHVIRYGIHPAWDNEPKTAWRRLLLHVAAQLKRRQRRVLVEVHTHDAGAFLAEANFLGDVGFVAKFQAGGPPAFEFARAQVFGVPKHEEKRA